MKLTEQERRQAKICIMKINDYFKDKGAVLRESFNYTISGSIYAITINVTTPPTKAFITVGSATYYLDPASSKWVCYEDMGLSMCIIENWEDIKKQFECACKIQLEKLARLNNFCI